MRRLREEPRRPRVHREEPVPVLDRVLDERPEPVDAGVADEPVETAEALDRLVHDAPRRVRRAHVAVEGERIGAELPELGHEPVQLGRRSDVHRRHAGGLPGRLRVPGEPDARRAADPARRSRHEHTHEGSSLLTRRARAAPAAGPRQPSASDPTRRPRWRRSLPAWPGTFGARAPRVPGQSPPHARMALVHRPGRRAACARRIRRPAPVPASSVEPGQNGGRERARGVEGDVVVGAGDLLQRRRG